MLIEQIIGIICAKSVSEEDFSSNYRKTAVLIKWVITKGDSIFAYCRVSNGISSSESKVRIRAVSFTFSKMLPQQSKFHMKTIPVPAGLSAE